MKQIRILLVEDDEDDYFLTTDLLDQVQGKRFDLEWVDEADEALEKMLAMQHDVYLVDYRMGAENGLELLRTAIASGCKAPIILLTGQGDHEVDVEAMEAGAVDYLVKGEISASALEHSIRYAIQRKKVEAELAETQQRLADSREEERLHLARELHDGPLQDLIGARFQLGVLKRLVKEEKSLTQLQSAQDNLHIVMQTLRTMCHELRPPALAPFGLERAIRAYAKRFQQAHPDLEIQLELDADYQSLPERFRLALYRIYQHALANIVRHAQASNIRVQFKLESHQVTLKIMDDGYGFVVPDSFLELAREGHLGLLGSAERASAIGGKLKVKSALDTGTTLLVTAPRPNLEIKN